MKIFIPTMGRPNKQVTYDNLPPALQMNTTLVVPLDEVRFYMAQTKAYVIGCPEKGIAPTRDWIMQYAKNTEIGKIVMLDDDIKFQKRNDAMQIKNATDQECIEAFQWLENTLNEHIHCGIAVRFNAFADPREYLSPGRMMHVLAYRPREVIESGAYFCKGVDKDHVMDDFNMTLQLLTMGYNNKVSLTYRTSPGKANSKGGASLWRNVEITNRSANNMKKNFPDFVRIREKKNWDGIVGAQQLDIVANWKKAYESSRSPKR